MRYFIYILNLLTLTGCTCTSSYHELALDSKFTLGNGNDGVIVGIEKFYRHCANKDGGVDLSRYKINNSENIISKSFNELVTQRKAMVVSHIIEFKKNIRNDIYNPFLVNEDAKPEYEEGYVQLDKLQKKIADELKNGNYTHIIFMSMGWHNDQFVSIDNYKNIITEIKNEDKLNIFNPYIVAITWPSAWLSNANGIIEKIGHLISYPNKADDADEVGFTIANYILHNVVLKSVSDVNSKSSRSKIKTVAIGHSFGARLLSQALFSKNYLKNDMTNNSQLDLFIGLQPAVSANRFIKGTGNEGSPYQNHGVLKTKILITASEYDNANPFAVWSEHLGGKDSFDTVKEHPESFNIYNARIDNNKIFGINFNELWKSPKKVEFVKCDFIKNHNDITDDEVGKFLFQIITNSNI